MTLDLRIGTSGWHYRHWLGNFYPAGLPQKEMLSHYLKHFDTVELNNSFYRLPAPEAFEAWKKATPPGFVFAVKGSRFITHMKKLKDPVPALAEFMPRARLLGRKLGPVLFQLPPHWKRNVERLEAFLKALPKRRRYAFEFRELSWMDDEVFDLLRRHNAAFCVYELAGYRSPIVTTADWTYVRLHGPTGAKYQGSYDDAALRFWRDRIDEWRGSMKASYVYFDNDQAGYAAANALRLKELTS